MKALPGETIGHYQIVKQLGSGGNGEVYRATDLRLMREVALKVLRGESDANAIEWLQKEARLASSLNHPNIVTIHDVGTKDTAPYIAMEFVNGATLRQLITDGLPKLDRLLGISRQIADGLAKAHDSGIVHRDLKPENVMLSDDGLVKILDFGLAKSFNTWNDNGSDCTTPDSQSPIVGTMGYMSPELVRGELVDYRSDQFTLGVILYEMCTGVRPFDRATAMKTLIAILQEDHVPLSRLKPSLPLPLCMLVDRCLSKQPAGRFESTRALAQALKTIQDEAQRCAALKLKPVVAVLPFDDISKNRSCRYFCEGVAEEIRGQLQKVTTVTLLSRLAIPDNSHSSIREVAAETGTDVFVGGSVRLFGIRARITAVLIRASNGHSQALGQYDRKFQNVLRTQTNVARRVVTALLSAIQ